MPRNTTARTRTVIAVETTIRQGLRCGGDGSGGVIGRAGPGAGGAARRGGWRGGAGAGGGESRGRAGILVELPVEGDGGVDQRQVGEGLGEVAQLLPRLADLLGIQP